MPPNKQPYCFAITGNIGSGKSAVSRLIGKCYQVYSADQIAQKYLDDPEIQAKLKNRFGTDIVCEGKTDRALLATIVFENPLELKWLENILHPLVLQEISRIIEQSQESVLFFEIPLLFEVGIQDKYDFIILVTCAWETRLERLLARSPNRRNEHIKRMNLQIPDQDKIPYCHYVINNDGSKEELEHKVQKFVQGIRDIVK
ncbi:MAG: dephospho-CoA kinase [Candidatus Cloacimonetes bacterium]|nr:dephospho-CoA kinase [Candidatus Cloacimonadota bacterium]